MDPWPAAPQRVTLPDGCRDGIREAAQRRIGNNRRAGIVDRQYSDRHGDDQEFNALAAEFLFSRLADCEWVPVMLGPDPGWDATMRDGWRVDVKWTPYPSGALIVRQDRVHRADAFALVTGVWPTYTYHGCIAAAELAAMPPTDRYPAGRGIQLNAPCHVALQGDLVSHPVGG